MAEARAPEIRNQPRPSEDRATPDQARQGFRGTPVLYVLVGGLVLAAIYLLSMLLWSGSEPTNPPVRQGFLSPAPVVMTASLPPPNQAI